MADTEIMITQKLVRECIENPVPKLGRQGDAECPDRDSEKLENKKIPEDSEQTQRASVSDPPRMADKDQVINSAWQVQTNEMALSSTDQENCEETVNSETRRSSKNFDEGISSDSESFKSNEEISKDLNLEERDGNRSVDLVTSTPVIEKGSDVMNNELRNDQQLVDKQQVELMEQSTANHTATEPDRITESPHIPKAAGSDKSFSEKDLSLSKTCHTVEKTDYVQSGLQNNAAAVSVTGLNITPGGSTVQVKHEPSDSDFASGPSQSSTCKLEVEEYNSKPAPLLSKGQAEKGDLKIKKNGSVIGDKINQRQEPNNKSVRELLLEGRSVRYQPIKTPTKDSSVITVVVTDPSQLISSSSLAPLPKVNSIQNKIPPPKFEFIHIPATSNTAGAGGRYQLIPTLNPTITERLKPANILPKPMVAIPVVANVSNQTTSNIIQQKTPVMTSSVTPVGMKPNVLPTYRAPTPPPQFSEGIPKARFECKACHDSFLFESSLMHHTSRRSVYITYTCEDCKLTMQFYNRCALVYHLNKHSTNVNGKKFSVRSIPPQLVCQEPAPVPQKCVPSQSPATKSLVTLRRSESMLSLTTIPSVNMRGQLKCTECGILISTFEIVEKHFSTTRKWSRCSVCLLNLPNACSLRAHTRTHNCLSPHVCPDCGELVQAGKEAFEKHLRYQCFHTNRKCLYKCPKCYLRIESQDEDPFICLRKHVQDAHGDIYYKCAFCPMAFKTLASFRIHFRETHENKEKKGTPIVKSIYKCPLCDTVFHNVDQLPTHIENHLVDYPSTISYVYKCNHRVHEDCKDTYADKHELCKHLLDKHGQKDACIYVCSVCGQEFKSKELLDNHSSTDHPDKLDSERKIRFKWQQSVNTCPLCKQSFSDQNQLVMHKRTAHRDNYPTTVVKVKLPDKQGPQKVQIRKILARPVQTVTTNSSGGITDEKNSFREKSEKEPIPDLAEQIPCPKCDNRFTKEEQLDEHFKSAHDIVRQYPCQLCGFTYTTAHDLKVHVKVIHEGRKEDYICWLCQEANVYKAYTKRQLLEKHITGFHKIPKCAIDYSKMKSLDESVTGDHGGGEETGHVKRKMEEEIANVPAKRLKVDGDSRFNCSKCQFSTEDKELFRNHIEEHKDTKDSLQCPECGMCFVVQPSLKKHLFIVHKIRNTSQYISESGMKGGMEPAEDEAENSLECTVCYKSFETVALLRTHMRSHGMAFIKKSKRVQSLHTNGN